MTRDCWEFGEVAQTRASRDVREQSRHGLGPSTPGIMVVMSELSPIDEDLLRQAIDLSASAVRHGNHPFGALLADRDAIPDHQPPLSQSDGPL